MSNNVYLLFEVNELSITRTDSTVRIPAQNRNLIRARFLFSADWESITPTAVFAREGIEARESVLEATEEGWECEVPSELMEERGNIAVSVYGGDRKVTNTALIQIVHGGYQHAVPPDPPGEGMDFVRTPGGSVKQIRWDDDTETFQVLVGDEWQEVRSGEGGTSDLLWRPTVTDGVISWARSTSATPPNPQDITGPPGKDGTGITILGSFDTVEELNTAHATGEVGDSYLVDGDLYVWSPTESAWKNVGRIQGPPGKDGSGGVAFIPPVSTAARYIGGGTRKLAMVSFICDDGPRTDITKILPVAQAKGVKFCSAPFINGLGTSGIMTWEDLQTLKDTGLWEFASHSITHPPSGATLTTLPEEQIINELSGSAKIFREHGFDVPTFVYPQGSTNELVRKIARWDYMGAFGTNAANNSYPLPTYNMRRRGIVAAGTLEQYKGYIDTAVANNQWVVFMIHSGSSSDFSAAQEQNLKDLIDYIKSQNVRIVWPSEGFKLCGNIIELGDTNHTTTLSHRRAVYGPNGWADEFLHWNNCYADTFNCATLPNDPEFLTGRTYQCVVYADKTGAPIDSGGVLVWHKLSQGYSYQEFIAATRRFTRRANGTDTAWGSWREITLTALT